MSTPTEPGWYWQDDGTRRYWDGASWTDIEPASTVHTVSERGRLPSIRAIANTFLYSIIALVSAVMLFNGAVMPGLVGLGLVVFLAAVEYL